MDKLTIEQQNDLINSVNNIHSVGLFVVPLLFIAIVLAVLFTRRNKAGNTVLGIFGFLVLVLIGSAPEPITQLWLSITTFVAFGFALLMQNVRQRGITYGQWFSEHLPFQDPK